MTEREPLPDVEPRHLADVELARRCAAGDETAWERFVRDYRPLLYRAADAIDHTGGARELADSLYADLFGLKGEGEGRRSLLASFQGRSSLGTWLRAVLAQRYVDRLRMQRRLEPLPDEDAEPHDTAVAAGRQPLRVDPDPGDPNRSRYLASLQEAVASAVAALDARDRLRLGCYYVQNLTLAATGRLLGEHEATVSRQLTRTRRAIRERVEQRLREQGFTDYQIAECVRALADDPGTLDLAQALDIR
jgi:RNA polymerase sigma factor (sigma-70 family)